MPVSKQRLTTGTRFCVCGTVKQYWAKRCRNCTIMSKKPPFDSTVYMIEDAPCRRIALTKNRYTLVWESDYDFLSQWLWHSIWSQSEKDHYAARGSNGKEELDTIMMARVIMQPSEDLEVDHKNHLCLDNRRSNLRVATSNQNAWNRRLRSCNTSGQCGVSWHKVAGKWFAYINYGKGRLNLGYYDSYEEACRVRREAEIKYFGEYCVEESVISEELKLQIISLLIHQATMTA